MSKVVKGLMLVLMLVLVSGAVALAGPIEEPVGPIDQPFQMKGPIEEPMKVNQGPIEEPMKSNNGPIEEPMKTNQGPIEEPMKHQ
jgi:hypothetical protein